MPKWYSQFSVQFPSLGHDPPIRGGETVSPTSTESRSIVAKRRRTVKLSIALALLSLTLISATPQPSEAPTGFDNKSNGLVDDATHKTDQTKFEEVEQLSDGLGPLYNAQSCRECHQSPVSGAGSQVTESRVGHLGSDRRFRNPEIPIAHGSEVIIGRSLVNDRAICPNAAFPDNPSAAHTTGQSAPETKDCGRKSKVFRI